MHFGVSSVFFFFILLLLCDGLGRCVRIKKGEAISRLHLLPSACSLCLSCLLLFFSFHRDDLVSRQSADVSPEAGRLLDAAAVLFQSGEFNGLFVSSELFQHRNDSFGLSFQFGVLCFGGQRNQSSHLWSPFHLSVFSNLFSNRLVQLVKDLNLSLCLTHAIGASRKTGLTVHIKAIPLSSARIAYVTVSTWFWIRFSYVFIVPLINNMSI